ncbi:tetratricopeptide repeat protein [Actinomarinicola tropica]|uniref:Tetratricopeptide repeat protein n=1 Tax=Actinomarinicola tropica TaxID=2789776 RepID=A0A5Q2RFT5_9ACTN|nr:tetratricopeptide repeat protein [Actinomarinicola tropica]QGG95678.1 tetratricopeptide repeat protein [Actinomarinicola tropica]
MVIDVTDATFESDVLDRSVTTPVVVDLWAPWCGPCRTLGPIIEKVVDGTEGKVVLAKVNVDENPEISTAFRVQGIPAVYAVKDRNVVDGFVGAQGEAAVAAFVHGLLPSEEETEIDRLIAAGDEDSLRAALELDPGHEGAVVALAELLVGSDRSEEALELLARVPDTPEVRRVAALARTGGAPEGDDVDAKLAALLDQVKDDDAARQEFVDILEVLGPDDPRTAVYRRQLAARLY